MAARSTERRNPPPRDWAPAPHHVSYPPAVTPPGHWKFEPPWNAPKPARTHWKFEPPWNAPKPARTPEPRSTTPPPTIQPRHKTPAPARVAPVPGVTITTVFSSTGTGATSAPANSGTSSGSSGLLLLAGAAVAGYLVLKSRSHGGPGK